MLTFLLLSFSAKETIFSHFLVNRKAAASLLLTQYSFKSLRLPLLHREQKVFQASRGHAISFGISEYFVLLSL